MSPTPARGMATRWCRCTSEIGLSYTTFQYSRLRISAPRLRKRAEVEVVVDVTNTGTRDGDEVVQVYVRFSGSKVARPLKELAGFKRVSIPRGATRTVWVPLQGDRK